jgi:hypothetical protein
VLKASVLNSSQSIPTWQELIDGKEWVQCSPATCAKLDIDAKNPNAVIDAARYRYLALESGSIGTAQLPHPIKIEPYLAPAHADDIAMLNTRVHDSLPEWDVTGMQQVVNSSLASKYAAYRHRVAARCNGNPNERMMFHFADPAVMTKIWQQGEGHDPRLSIWAEVGNGAYFSKHAMYGYAYKYCLWPSPPSFTVKPEPPIGESMQVFVSLVCLGNVADVGPGCETCTSPAWEEWKKEPPVMPKPTRPPAMTLPADAAEKQHVLDLMQVKDAPRSDSVMSTEGDLGTHISSTSKDASGRRMCDIMHPRLRARAREWAEQCVVFDAAASYPMFVVTLTKNRDSPMGLQQLMDAGCDPNRIKALGFTASQTRALGKTTREMRAAGWPVTDMKGAGFDAGSLVAGGYSVSELKSVSFTASQMKDAGCRLQQLKNDFSLEELKDAFDIQSLCSAGYSLSDMRGASFSAFSLKAVGCSAEELKDAGFSASEQRDAGFDLAALDQAGYDLLELKSANFTDAELSQTATFAKAEAALQKARFCFVALQQLGAGDALDQRQAEDTAGHFFIRIQIRAAIDDLVDALRHPDILKNHTTAASLRAYGMKAYHLHAAGFSLPTLDSAGYSLQDLANLQIDSCVTPALLFMYKHWKMLRAALLVALTSIVIGLCLGDVNSMMVLVVCLPHAVAFFTHWKCATKDGTRYKRIWASAFAAYFCAVFSLSLGFMLGMPCKDHNARAAIMIFTVCLPTILGLALRFVVWSSRNVGSPYPQKYIIGFALVLVSVFALSLGLVVGLSSDPLKLRAYGALSDEKKPYYWADLHSVAWSPDGTKVATASSKYVYIWSSSAIDPVSGSAFVFAVWASSILCSILHSVISPCPAKLWKFKCGFLVIALTGSLGLVVGLSVPKIIELTGHSGGVSSVAWSPDGSKIATASHDGTARVWSSSSGSTLLTLYGHSGKYNFVNSVAWSPDGSKIATASGDGTARVWSSSSGSTLLTLYGHSKIFYSGEHNFVNSVAWSPDGSKIATASHDGTARVWSSSSGSTLLTLT